MTTTKRTEGPRPCLHGGLVALCAVVLGSAAQAQGPTAGDEGLPFVDRIAVELVEVEVQATDSAGRPVLDLTADELAVTDDGRAVAVEYFSPPAAGRSERRWVSPGAPEADGRKPPLVAEPGTRLVVFLDDLATSPVSRTRVIDALDRALDERLGPRDEVLVARYSGGVEVVQPFTRDRAKIAAALDRLRGFRAYHLMMGMETERTLNLLRMSLENDEESNPASNQPSSDICVKVGGIVRSHADEARGRVLGAIGGLERFVNSLAGVPGRKALLYVSDGIELIAGGVVWRYAIEMCDGTAMRAGIPNAADTTSMGGAGRLRRFDPIGARVEMEKYDTTREWQALTADANAQGVTLYTVQAAGLVGARSAQASLNVRLTLGAEQFAARNLQDPLEIIARETGGRAIFNANDPTAALGQVLDETASRYVLAYAPPRPADGREHRIEVEASRPGVRLRHRERYRAKTFEDRIVDGVLASLYHGEEDNRLGVTVEIGKRTPVDEDLVRLTVRVRVPLAQLTLLPDPRGRQGLFTVYLAARDDEGGTTPIRSRSIPVSVPAAGQQEMPEDGEFVYEVEIDLRDRPHDLSVGVRDDFGGTTAFVRKRVEQPRPQEGAAKG